MRECYVIGMCLFFAQENSFIIRNARGHLSSVGEEYTASSPWVTASGLTLLLCDTLVFSLSKHTHFGNGLLMNFSLLDNEYEQLWLSLGY